MSSCPELRTRRLTMRCWREDDAPAFAEMNADPRVMRFFGAPFTREQSDRLLHSIMDRFETQGFGFWALQRAVDEPPIGFAGLNVPTFNAPFMPAVEIGWRLRFEYWGQGFATEAAGAALDFAFDVRALPQVVSFAVEANERSRAVMERLGMHHDPADDFEHPLVSAPELRHHVLYRIAAEEWQR